ncbi:hypothetical protein FS837_004451 [Tulasnella sp. UAMH 9824]|nr:hypothetical protein FS837_004451 [Tulasnella sp. UAMH 9824]
MSSSQHSPSRPVSTAPSETEPSTPTPSTSEIVPSQSPSAVSNQELDPLAKVRNAAAQARHRAKRRAYVAQLEQSVNTLKDTLKNATNKALVQQLEDENRRLTEELQYLQMQLEGSNSSDDGQGISNAAQWVGMSNYGVSGSQIGDANDFDENLDSTEFGLKGWSPEQK